MLEEATETGQSARRPASAAAQGADYAGAYSGSGQPVAVHQHWLSLCAIVGVRAHLCPTCCGQSILEMLHRAAAAIVRWPAQFNVSTCRAACRRQKLIDECRPTQHSLLHLHMAYWLDSSRRRSAASSEHLIAARTTS